MKTLKYFFAALIIFTTFSCKKEEEEKQDDFKYQTEQFADLAILRFKVNGFEDLSLKQKEMLYYLYEAALAG
ncbi:MAG: dihydrofolate reductase, partial [Ignavibacteria bacterium]|nr:dihydrofolate reductase [Ignavibacteria bacterium]